MENKVKQALLEGIAKVPETARYYAKGSCKHCLGRGLITMDITCGPGQFARGQHICQCVSKGLNKQNG